MLSSYLRVTSFALLSIMPSLAVFAESPTDSEFESIRHVYNYSQSERTVEFTSNQIASTTVQVPPGEEPCQVKSTPIAVTYICPMRAGEEPLIVHYQLATSGSVSVDGHPAWHFSAKGSGTYIHHPSSTPGAVLNDPANGDIELVNYT